jgi:hypothetical protein
MAKLTDTRCGHCGRQTIGGWSGTGELLSMLVSVDADPLASPEEELAALVAGCPTWTLHPVARQLHPRSARMIRTRPVGHPRQTVHAEHRCTPRPWRSWT